MDKSSLQTWKQLQDKNYFDKHPFYKEFAMGVPHPINLQDIQNKIVAEIGCGYGRETWFFTKFAKKVYAIDVSDKILILAKKFVTEPNTEFVLAEEYKEKIKEKVDFVYALHVLQHLSEEQTIDYINTFYEKLNIGGKILIQFYEGIDKILEEGREPKLQYTREEIRKLLKDYTIEEIWKKEKYSLSLENKHLYNHLYILAVKKEK